MSRQLDAEVAEVVMGWADMGASYYTLSGGFAAYKASWAPSESYAQCAIVRAEIERRGLEARFIEYLRIEANAFGENPWGEWHLLNATPEAQCRAAIAAVKGAR